jgi:Rrf2 family protein
VRISAKTDYAVRAMAELAACCDGDHPVKAERLADAQDIPLNFLENILGQLRQAGLVASRRGPEGGFLLARPAAEIAVADVIRAIDGPLAGVSGRRPETLEYSGAAAPMRETWVAVRASLRDILERVTLADLAAGELPEHVVALTKDPDAWLTR